MGRVRTKTVKRASRAIIEKYYPRLTLDFHTNKRICQEVAAIPSKRLRNKIAGFTTHLMKRIQKGPVHGISFKLQEEERERRDNYVPEKSEIADRTIRVDRDTKAMLVAMNMFPKDAKVYNVTKPQIPGKRRRVGGNKRKAAAPAAKPAAGKKPVAKKVGAKKTTGKPGMRKGVKKPINGKPSTKKAAPAPKGKSAPLPKRV